MTQPKPQTITAWISLVTANRVLLSGIETALKNAGMPNLGWYDALLEIEKAGATGIRPFELKERLLLPQYGMSRLLERMKNEGLIDRREVEEDGRGQIVSLTTKGQSIRQKMWPIYAKSLMESVEQHLSQSDAEELARLLKLLVSRGN